MHLGNFPFIILDVDISNNFIEIGLPSKDVVARDDILRTQRLPVVVAVLHVVVHAYLLQVLAASEGAVLDDHLQVAIRVLRAPVGLVELHGLQLVAAGKGTTAHGQRLVVVVAAYVVVDAQHAVVALQVVGVGALNGGIVDGGFRIVGQQLTGIEVLIVSVPRAQLSQYVIEPTRTVVQIAFAIGLHALVTRTILSHFVARGFIADDAVLHGRPHAAVAELL